MSNERCGWSKKAMIFGTSFVSNSAVRLAVALPIRNQITLGGAPRMTLNSWKSLSLDRMLNPLASE